MHRYPSSLSPPPFFPIFQPVNPRHSCNQGIAVKQTKTKRNKQKKKNWKLKYEKNERQLLLCKMRHNRYGVIFCCLFLSLLKNHQNPVHFFPSLLLLLFHNWAKFICTSQGYFWNKSNYCTNFYSKKIFPWEGIFKAIPLKKMPLERTKKGGERRREKG